MGHRNCPAGGNRPLPNLFKVLTHLGLTAGPVRSNFVFDAKLTKLHGYKMALTGGRSE